MLDIFQTVNRLLVDRNNEIALTKARTPGKTRLCHLYRTDTALTLRAVFVIDVRKTDSLKTLVDLETCLLYTSDAADEG